MAKKKKKKKEMKVEKHQLYYLALIVIIFTALFLRIQPAMQTTEPMKFDTYYHSRTAELIKEQGIVEFEPWPNQGRPNLYPPGYHLILIAVSLLGIGMTTAAKFTLPIIFTFSIGSTYWLIKQYKPRETALITSFFLAINAVLITESFGSPQVIAFIFFLGALQMYLEKKQAYSGLIMGAAFWFSPMGAAFFTIPLLIHSLLKNYKQTHKFILPAIAIALIWILLKIDLFYSFNTLAFDFFAKKINFNQFLNPWYLLLVFIAIPLLKKPKKDIDKIFLILTITSFLFYLSFYYTKIFHPWRQPFFLMIGLSYIAAEISTKNKKFLVTTTTILLLMLSMLSFPGLSNSDFQAINQFNENDLVLAGHDTCAIILTKTKANCMLDIFFESIEDKKIFIELESFFWASTPEQMQQVLDNYEFNKVMINSNAWSDTLLDETSFSKTYITFECWGSFCTKPASIYER